MNLKNNFANTQICYIYLVYMSTRAWPIDGIIDIYDCWEAHFLMNNTKTSTSMIIELVNNTLMSNEFGSTSLIFYTDL